MPRRFPAPWFVDELEECFVIKDRSGQPLAYVYFEPDPNNESRRAVMNRLTREEARRIAAKIATLPASVDKDRPEQVLRERAKECRERAEAANDPSVKAHFHEMADTWDRLARQSEMSPDDPQPKALR